MAETKSKKQPPKIADITKPGKSAPSSSARPIIITHRPMLQDPMMVQNAGTSEGSSEEMTGVQPVARMGRSITLQPLEDDERGSVTPGAPALETGVGTGKTIAVLAEEAAKRKGENKESDKPEDSEESDTINEDTEVKNIKTVPETDMPEDETDKPAEEKPALESVEAADDKSADTPEDKVEEKTETKTPAKTEEKADEKASEEPELSLGEDAAPSSPGNEPGDTNLSEAAQREALAAQKLAEEQEKIIMSGKYYLPIDAVAHRRTKRHIMLGLMLILLLAAALFLVGWDANFFSIPGYTAPTDYL